MKMYLPFGDWSHDGHGQYEKILISAPSMDNLLNAQQKIKDKYGKFFFQHFATEYMDSSIGDDIWQALEDTGYLVERLIEKDEVNDWTGVKSLAEIREYDESPSLSLDVIIDMFIWLLNYFGAEIVRLDLREEIPMINNWTCSGFETVGYGCFWS